MTDAVWIEPVLTWVRGLHPDVQMYVILSPAALTLLLIGWAFDRRVRFDGKGWPFGVHGGHDDPDDLSEADADGEWLGRAEDAIDEAVNRRRR